MILPTKGIEPERALLTVGADVLSLLDSPATVSALWERFSQWADKQSLSSKVTFDWFALALSWLYAIGGIAWDSSGRLVKGNVSV